MIFGVTIMINGISMIYGDEKITWRSITFSINSRGIKKDIGE